jgi:hypothetical protein
MSTRTLPRIHPLTGRALRPVGYRKNGRAIFPVLGGSEPPNQSPANPPNPPASPAEKPDGVTDAEWAALGDPGKAAIVRERQRATAAEQALAAARANPPTPPKLVPPKPIEPPKPGEPVDIAAQIRAGIEAAMAPLLERDATREASQAAEKIREAVTTAASERFHDASDALAQIDLTTLTDGEGKADPAKVTAALDDLLTRKPHLGKAVDNRRRAADGSLIGGAPGAEAPLDDRVKATLARMQASTGVKFAEA